MVERLKIKRSDEELALVHLVIEKRQGELEARYSNTVGLCELIHRVTNSLILDERCRLAVFDAIDEAELEGMKIVVRYMSGQSEMGLEKDVMTMRSSLGVILPEKTEGEE